MEIHTSRRLLYSIASTSKSGPHFRRSRAPPFRTWPPANTISRSAPWIAIATSDPKPAQSEFSVVAALVSGNAAGADFRRRAAIASVFCRAGVQPASAIAARVTRRVEKKVAERTRELEIASRELLHSQKMNALGTLAAGIAHDFNNILSIIKGSAQIIEDNVDNPKKVHTRVDRIKTVVEQGAGIVKAMLGFSRDSDSSRRSVRSQRGREGTIKLLGDRFLREVR